MPSRGQPDVIRGKWHGHTYRVIRLLGQGANGVVYQVESTGRPLALKIGNDTIALTSEINVLREFQKAQGTVLGPSLYDVDDWVSPDGLRPFYVMDLVEGVPIDRYVQEKGMVWLTPLVMQLLSFLHQLHRLGWVFGDLKPEHLFINGRPPRLTWFDAGGVTRLGHAVKEYTERYDRGFWQMGDRRADVQYDLFSVALIIVQMARGRPLEAVSERPQDTFVQLIRQTSALQPFIHVLERAFTGQYESADKMKSEWLAAQQRFLTARGRSKQQASMPRRGSSMTTDGVSIHASHASSFVRTGAAGTAKRGSRLRKGGRLILKVIKVTALLALSSFLALLFALYLVYQAL